MSNLYFNAKQITAFLLGFILFSTIACTPEKEITDKNYKISLTLESSLPDKKIADNTAVFLVEKGKTDSLKTYTVNELANFSFEAPENSNLSLEIHVNETLGHKGFIYAYKTDRDKSIKFILEAKTHSVPVSIHTTRKDTPIGNIEYTINPGDKTGETDASGNKIISFSLNTDDYNEPLNTNATINFTQSPTTKDMHYERTILTEGTNDFTFDLNKETWEHYFNVTTTSNIPGKTPLLNEAIGTISYDNKTENFNPETGTIRFISDNETENNILVQVSNVPNYKNGEITVNNTGNRTKNNENYNLTLEGIIYNATIPIKTTNGTNPITTNINYELEEQTGTTTTGTDGTTNITINNLTTNNNNKPQEEYVLKTTTTKTGYQENKQEFNITTGTNQEKTISMKPNEYWMTGTITPEGSTIKAWNKGQIIFNETGGTYATDTIPNTTEPFTLDSITVTKEGHIKQKLTNVTLNKNEATTKNFTLEKETYNYWLTGNNTSPEGTNIEVWDEGNNIANGIVNGTSYNTNQWTNINNTMNIDSIVFKKNGFIPQTLVNVTVNPGENNQEANLEEKTYTTTINGKVLDLTKQRIKNKPEALVITNASGKEYKLDIDANGEIHGDIITNDPNETVTAYWNETTMSDYDKNTIAFDKDNEIYPIDRVITGDYKPNEETTRVSVNVNLLDDDYLRIYAGKDAIVENDTLQFAVKGYSNQGSFNYGRREPLRPYVYTLLPDGTTVSSSDQQNMELAVDQARNIFYDQETGWAIPINNRKSGTDPGARSGNWLMRQLPGQGYWNLGYLISGETNLLEGGEAQVDLPVEPHVSYNEMINPWIRDGPDGSDAYSSTWNNGIPTLTDLGKAHITITTDFPAGSGKE